MIPSSSPVHPTSVRDSVVIERRGASQAESGLPADAVAKVIGKAVTACKPRTRYTIGRDTALLPSWRILPDRILDRVFAAALRPHFPRRANEHYDYATALR